MSNIPADLLYTPDDEWVKIENGVATIGITFFAQDSLSDIVFLELPDVGAELVIGDTFGVVESVKAAADLYAPLSGRVIAINDPLLDIPETINDDPYGAWMVKVEIADIDQVQKLLDAEAYEADVASRS